MSATPEQISDAVVEHVARAICEATSGPFEMLDDVGRDALGWEARAAIEAYLTATSSAADARISRLEDAATHLCAAIDNLWNHPDLRHVRADIPESIKLNISRGQLLVRAALGSAE